jgi:hypothetical protein
MWGIFGPLALGAITFAYKLHFKCMVTHWKDLNEKKSLPWMKESCYNPHLASIPKILVYRLAKMHQS